MWLFTKENHYSVRWRPFTSRISRIVGLLFWARNQPCGDNLLQAPSAENYRDDDVIFWRPLLWRQKQLRRKRQISEWFSFNLIGKAAGEYLPLNTRTQEKKAKVAKVGLGFAVWILITTIWRRPTACSTRAWQWSKILFRRSRFCLDPKTTNEFCMTPFEPSERLSWLRIEMQVLPTVWLCRMGIWLKR